MPNLPYQVFAAKVMAHKRTQIKKKDFVTSKRFSWRLLLRRTLRHLYIN